MLPIQKRWKQRLRHRQDAARYIYFGWWLPRLRLNNFRRSMQYVLVFMIHVGCTRCVTSNTGNNMKRHARISLGVECIRTCLCFYFYLMFEYNDEYDQYFNATFFDLIDLQVLPTVDCPHSASVPTSVARSHETLRLRPRRSIPTVPSGEKPFVESAFVEKPLLKNFVEKPFLKGFIGVRLTRPPFVFVPRSLR